MKPVASIDGFGDRDDIALADSIAEGKIFDNKFKFDSELHEALLKSSEWGDLNEQYIVDLIIEIINRGKGSMLGNKKDVFWGDIESISEAVNDACIQLGLDEEYYSPTILCDGFEYEISLY